MTKLKTANIGHNKFCGPAVLSILTGKTTDECARVISKINGAYQVAGVQLDHLLQACDKLGFNQRKIETQGSLYRSLVQIARQDGIYIITVPSHFVVIEVSNEKIYFCDNHTKEPIQASGSARLMQECLACYRVERRSDYVEPPTPHIIKTEYKINIVKYYETYQIQAERETIWNLDEYNKTEYLGAISFKNKNELEDLAAQLASELEKL